MGEALPSVTQGYVILRKAELNKDSHDKVVTWTDGSNERDNVIKAFLRLDHIETSTKPFRCFTTSPIPLGTMREQVIPQMEETLDIIPGVLYTDTQEVRDYGWRAMSPRTCCTFDKFIDNQIMMK